MTGKKLLFYVTEDWYFCSHRLPLAIAAREAGYEVAVLTHVDKHGEVIRHSGLRLIPLPSSCRGMNIAKDLRTIFDLIRIYARERPELVHHVAVKPTLYGSLAAIVTGINGVVNALAGMGWIFTSNSRRARIIKAMVRLAFRLLLRNTHVIVQNPDDEGLVRSLSLSKVHVIKGSGVDISVFRPSPEGGGVPMIVLPARMLWDKGVGEFVEAARYCLAQGCEARFVLVGGADDQNPAGVAVETLRGWNAEGIIEWWGQSDEMPQVYRQAHIVCLPSYREGLPKVLLEAAASARPIVATDVPGCREIVKDGVNGLLVPVRDAVALGEALARLIADPVLRGNMGARGRDIVVTEFSQQCVNYQTMALYDEIRA